MSHYFLPMFCPYRGNDPNVYQISKAFLLYGALQGVPIDLKVDNYRFLGGRKVAQPGGEHIEVMATMRRLKIGVFTADYAVLTRFPWVTPTDIDIWPL